MTGSSSHRRGRGRPRRLYRVRVRAERREKPDYDKLARALLEHAAMQDDARRPRNEETAHEDDVDESEGERS